MRPFAPAQAGKPVLPGGQGLPAEGRESSPNTRIISRGHRSGKQVNDSGIIARSLPFIKDFHHVKPPRLCRFYGHGDELRDNGLNFFDLPGSGEV